MPKVNEEVCISGIEDIFTLNPEYHQIKLVCSLENIRPYKQKRLGNSELFGNVATFPDILYEYEIVIAGSAFNCFENCPVNIFMTFAQDKLAWERYKKSIGNLINNHRAVMVIANVYNIQDGEFSLFNPTISPTNCHVQNVGFHY
jgi:hypothetical protein